MKNSYRFRGVCLISVMALSGCAQTSSADQQERPAQNEDSLLAASQSEESSFSNPFESTGRSQSTVDWQIGRYEVQKSL